MPKGIVLRPPLITILESKCYGAAAQSSSSRTAGTHGRPEVRFHTTAAARVAKFPVNYELPHTGALKNMGASISPSSTRRRGKANAHRDRYRRRGRDWPDLVGRSDVRVGPRGQRRRRAKHPDGSRHWSPLLKMPTPNRPLDYFGSAGLLWAINGGRLVELRSPEIGVPWRRVWSANWSRIEVRASA
jgi:hypothetical protein